MIWLILLIAFGVLPSLLAGAKKAAKALDTDASDEQTGEGNEDDGFFSFDEVEEEETVAQQPSYFTYEAPDVEVPPVQPAAKATAAPVVEEQPVTPAFDLRQAVIYQTLLNNKYINAES